MYQASKTPARVVIGTVFLIAFGVAAVLTWLIMVAFIFAEFGGWGFLALALTPVVTGFLGPPLMWLVSGVPELALITWGVMVASGIAGVILRGSD